MKEVIDSQARQEAIVPHASFLVQAPAGSGKTELLIQRILGLLAIVDEPEEILALTFTRKAAAEMRERVLKALLQAQQPQPTEPHAQTTWLLAREALNQSQSKGWHLIDYPARFRIMTIDAFASGLARQLPVLSGFGQSPTTADDALPMYQAAVDAIFSYTQQKNAPKPLKQAMDTLILHQECNLHNLSRLLCNMLARREQWLPDVMQHSRDMPSFRLHIEHCLRDVIEHHLNQAYTLLPENIKGQLPVLASFAEEQLSLSAAGKEQVLSPLHGLQSFPTATMNNLKQWQALVHLLLLKSKPEARKTVSKTLGFPTEKDVSGAQVYKDNMLEVLSWLEDYPALLQQLDCVRMLPNQAEFDDDTWHVLESLFLVLKILAAQLWQTFEQHKKVDFVEVMLRAKQALGQENSLREVVPSEALLRLDYQIKHILIDEFQDTSTLQIDLLSRLTAGWADDGRSLFMVGDPMQSIYRFRKAEVSLFLKAADNALPEHQKIPQVKRLVLQQNFRSSPDIVRWVNNAFSKVFPKKNDALDGAISYTASQAFKAEQGSVSLHLLKERHDEQEADLMLHVIKTARAQHKSIGILARNRSHLKALMALLQQENIPFRALDMLVLAKQPEIMDLRSLTRALLHPCDSVAWASMLRAPSTGLELDTLHQIFNSKPDSAWQAIEDYAQAIAQCADQCDVQHRLNQFIHACSPAMARRGKVGLRSLVESTWLRLATPATLSTTQLANTDAYFALLEQLEEEGSLQLELLDQRLDKLYAKPESQAKAEKIELMTMHGSKGLQWDTVILPGLGKTPRPKDKDVLMQTEVYTKQGQQLLLSPLPQHKKETDKAKVYDLIRDFEKQRDALETARLLYVACTRAESSLHLFGHVQGEKDLPASASLLALLWQDEGKCYGASVHVHDVSGKIASPNISAAPQAQCLPVSFQATTPQSSISTSSHAQPLAVTHHQPEFSWAGASAKAVGIAVHAALQDVAESGVEHWNDAKHSDTLNMMQRILIKEGISQSHLNQAFSRCQKALNTSLKSDKARWVLSEKHQEQHNEWALTYLAEKQCKHIVLDRSFVDQDGTRWVIDYKTGGHEGAGLEGFLDQELIRYTQETPQLPNYVKALQALEPQRKIKAALYFPMVDGWRVWRQP